MIPFAVCTFLVFLLLTNFSSIHTIRDLDSSCDSNKIFWSLFDIVVTILGMCWAYSFLKYVSSFF